MKRIFWSGVGYAAGLSSSIYVQRRVRRAVDHYTPEQVRSDVTAKSRQVASKAREVVIDLQAQFFFHQWTDLVGVER